MSALSFLKKSRVTSKVSKRGTDGDGGVEKMFEKMSLGEPVKDKASKSIVKDVVSKGAKRGLEFTHSIYGMLIRGVHKGYEVEVVKYYPDMYEISLDDKILFVKGSDFKKVGRNRVKMSRGLFNKRIGKILGKRVGKLDIILNSKRITISPRDLLYKDVLLTDGTYAHVNTVTTDDSGYTFRCTILGNRPSGRVIKQSDIKQMMPGFSIKDGDFKRIVQVDQDIQDEPYRYSEVVVDGEAGDEAEEDESDSIDYEDEMEGEKRMDEGEEQRAEFGKTFDDYMRVQEISELTELQKKYIRMVDDVLKRAEYSEEHIRSKYVLVDDLVEVINALRDKIRKLNINFDIEKSVDIKIIVACLVFRETIRSGALQDTLDDYIARLVSAKYISTVSTSIVFSKSGEKVIPCDVKREDIQKVIRTIMVCYNNIIGDLLDVNINIETNIRYEPEYIKPEPKSKLIKNFVTINDIKSGKDFSQARSIIWGPYYKERLDTWLQTDGKDEHEFIKQNIMKAPIVINNMWEEMIQSLRGIPGFSEKYDSCMDGVCRNMVVTEYINGLPKSDDKRVERLKLFGRLADVFRMLVRD